MGILDTVRPTPKPGNRVVLFGDSITANGWAADSVGSPPFVCYGGYSIFEYANIALGQRMNILSNLGVAGNTTAQLLARISSVLTLRPDWVILMAGVNDVQTDVPVATIQTNLTAIVSTLTAAGVRVVLAPPLSSGGSKTQLGAAWTATTAYAVGDVFRNGATSATDGNGNKIPATYYRVTTGYTSGASFGATDTTNSVVITSRYQALHQLQRWVSAYARDTPGVVPCEWHKLFEDSSSGQSLLEMTIDGTHPNVLGASTLGAFLATVLAPLMPAAEHLPVTNGDYENYAKNPMMTGSGGTLSNGVTGTSAASVTVAGIAGAATTAVASLVNRTDGVGAVSSGTAYPTGSPTPGQWLQVAVPAGQKVDVLLAQFNVDSSYVGKTVIAECEFQLDSLAGTPEFALVVYALTSGFSSLGRAYDIWPTEKTLGKLVYPTSGVYRTFPLVLPATTGIVQVHCWVDGTVGNVSGGGNFRLGRNGIYLSTAA